MSTLETSYTSSVTRPEKPWDPIADAVGLNRSLEEYRSDLEETALSLGRLTSLPKEIAEAIAFEIVGRDIPEEATRTALREQYEPTVLNLGSSAMRALDGGYHAMWKTARMRAESA